MIVKITTKGEVYSYSRLERDIIDVSSNAVTISSRAAYQTLSASVNENSENITITNATLCYYTEMYNIQQPNIRIAWAFWNDTSLMSRVKAYYYVDALTNTLISSSSDDKR